MTVLDQQLIEMLYQLQRQLRGREWMMRQTWAGTWIDTFQVADIQAQIDRIVNK